MVLQTLSDGTIDNEFDGTLLGPDPGTIVGNPLRSDNVTNLRQLLGTSDGTKDDTKNVALEYLYGILLGAKLGTVDSDKL